MPQVATANPAAILGILIFSVRTVWFIDTLFPLKELVLGIPGRRPDLTDRTDIWAILLTLEGNPVVYVGYMSFWTGPRLEAACQLLGMRINQAHNGYLEQYLNLGYIGVGFIIAIMLTGLLRVHNHLKIDPPAGMLRLCLISVAAVYNYTEAAFYCLNNMWILLLLACIENTQPKASSEQRTAQTASDRERNWIPHSACMSSKGTSTSPARCFADIRAYVTYSSH